MKITCACNRGQIPAISARFNFWNVRGSQKTQKLYWNTLRFAV